MQPKLRGVRALWVGQLIKKAKRRCSSLRGWAKRKGLPVPQFPWDRGLKLDFWIAYDVQGGMTRREAFAKYFPRKKK